MTQRTRILGLTVASLTLCAVTANAQTAPHTIAHSGLWDAYSAADTENRPLCGISTTGPDGRRIAIEQSQSQSGLTLSLTKSTWTIPPNTPVDLNVRLDTSFSTALHANGAGTTLDVMMDFDQTVPFMRALRYGQQLQVSFPSGNEAVWTGGLSGSSRAIDAFNECRHNLTPPVATQPFTAPDPTNGAPTQPFTAPSSPPVPSTNLPPLPQATGKPARG